METKQTIENQLECLTAFVEMFDLGHISIHCLGGQIKTFFNQHYGEVDLDNIEPFDNLPDALASLLANCTAPRLFIGKHEVDDAVATDGRIPA